MMILVVYLGRGGFASGKIAATFSFKSVFGRDMS